MMQQAVARFHVGQVIHHRLFGYRGVIVDVDPDFQGSEEWYARVAKSQPPKDRPWYRVLVDDAEYVAYVAERNLEFDDSGDPVTHPLMDNFFTTYSNGAYVSRQVVN